MAAKGTSGCVAEAQNRVWRQWVSQTYHVWIFLWICDTDVCELDVQVLKHTGRRGVRRLEATTGQSHIKRWGDFISIIKRILCLTWSTEWSVPQMLQRETEKQSLRAVTDILIRHQEHTGLNGHGQTNKRYSQYTGKHKDSSDCWVPMSTLRLLQCIVTIVCIPLPLPTANVNVRAVTGAALWSLAQLMSTTCKL